MKNFRMLLKVAIIFFCYANKSFSQNFMLEGRVLDESKKAIEFANVILLKSDSTYLTGTITDTLGRFKISAIAGKYLVQVRIMGFLNFNSSIQLTKNEILEDITLKVNGMNLGGIVVTATKPIVKREIDRLVFDTKGLAVASTNAVDVLKNVPGLIVTNDQITIIGKGEVKVLINDKELKISGGDLLNLLKSYKASDINKVEVITTPPAKYDAEGDAGIVNIVLEKVKLDFIGGNLSFNQSFSNTNRSELSSSLTYNKNNITSFLNIGNGIGKSLYQENNTKFFPTRNWISSTDIHDKVNYQSLRAGVDYQFKKGLSMGVHATTLLSKPNQVQENETNIYSLEQVNADSSLRLNNNIQKLIKRGTINFHIDKKLDTLGKMLRLDVDFFGYSSLKNEKFLSNTYDSNGNLSPSSEFKFNNDNSIKLQAVSSTIDFLLPFIKFTLGFGAKTSFSKTKSQINYYNHTFLNDQNDLFEYDENISALYADFNKKINTVLSLKLGIRLEFTSTKGVSKLIGNKLLDRYTKAFPTIFLRYTPNENNKFNLSLSSRISRPGFNRVNPFKLYENQFSIISGKPDLKPATIYTFNMGYTLKNNFNLDLYYIYKSDLYTQIIKMDSVTNISNNIWDNFLTSHAIGVTNSYNYDKLNWVQSYIQHGVYFSKSISNSEFTIKQRSGIVYTASITNTFYLNKDKTLTGQISATYSSKQYTAPTIINPNYDMDAGIEYSLFDGALNLGLNIYYIILNDFSGMVNSNGMIMKYNNKYAFRNLNLNGTYNFGAKLSRKERKYSTLDIQNRL